MTRSPPGQLTREEIAQGESNSAHRLHLSVSKVVVPEVKKTRGPRYTPLSRRQDRPNAILWLVRNHPELKDAQIMRLVGTTKATLKAIRERTHWNSAALTPMDPVTLGLCSQIDLDFEVNRAAKDRAGRRGGSWPDAGPRKRHHQSASRAVHDRGRLRQVRPRAPSEEEDNFDADRVFGRLKDVDFGE